MLYHAVPCSAVLCHAVLYCVVLHNKTSQRHTPKYTTVGVCGARYGPLVCRTSLICELGDAKLTQRKPDATDRSYTSIAGDAWETMR